MIDKPFNSDQRMPRNNALVPKRVIDFLGRALMSVVFVHAVPGKLTDFQGNTAFIASKGIPEPLANVLLFAAILVLIGGSILFVFGSNTKLGASLLLIFLVPTTLIFHTFPIDLGFYLNLSLIGALILAITRSTGGSVPSFRELRGKS